jgi:hypothetical protein
MHAHGCTLINGFCIEMSAWCFDQKWWMHAYTCMTIFGLLYIYIYTEQVQISSPSSGELSPTLNSRDVLVGFPQRHLLLGRFPHYSRAGVSSLKGLPFK